MGARKFFSPNIILFTVFLIFSFTVLAADTPFGINAHIPDTRTLDMITQAGINWIRVDFNWFNIEPAQNQFNWSTFDNVVNQARARGLNIFATLAYTPAWACDGDGINEPPRDVNDWVDFVSKTVNRYKSKVKYWGMWNEPNLSQFWSGNAWQYREWILKPGYNAAKAADPSCVVVAPDLAHLSSASWWEWLDEICKADGKNYFDVFSHHCYSGDGADAVMSKLEHDFQHNLRDEARKLGLDSKPFWLTEVGWTCPGDGDENWQATQYNHLLGYMWARSWWHKVFFYEIKDDPNWDQKYGIIYANYSPKQAYYAYRDFIANPQPREGPEYGCFSLSAIQDDQQINAMRNIRDNILAKSSNGIVNIFIYYAFSDQIKGIIKAHPEIGEKIEQCTSIFTRPFIQKNDPMRRTSNMFNISPEYELKRIDIFSANDIEMIIWTCEEVKKYADPSLIWIIDKIEDKVLEAEGARIEDFISEFDFAN